MTFLILLWSHFQAKRNIGIQVISKKKVLEEIIMGTFSCKI